MASLNLSTINSRDKGEGILPMKTVSQAHPNFPAYEDSLTGSP